MLRLIVILATALLASCATEPTKKFKYIRGSNLVTYESGHAVNHIASTANFLIKSAEGSTATGTFDATDYPYFRDAHTGRSWLSARQFRALAIGVPDACSVRYRTWEYTNPEVAISVALRKCLAQAKRLGAAVGQKCGCRVAGIDDVMFVAPAEFPYRHKLPALLSVESVAAGEPRREMLGMLDLNNIQDTYVFRNLKGKTVCSGSLERDRGGFSGVSRSQCFEGRLKGRGTYRITGYVQGNLSGLSEVDFGETKVRVIFGLSDADFAAKRAALSE